MIPRYAPTYRFPDLFRSWSMHTHEDLEEKLRYRLAEFYKVKYVYLTRTAGTALYVLLKAYDRPGGVLTSAYNDLVVPEVIQIAGYYPVFADINYETLQMDMKSVDEATLSEITVIVPVHLFGVPCEWGDVERILKEDRPLIIEDVAPAFGAEYQGRPAGILGDAAIISFHHTKIVSAEIGGVLITDNDNLAQKIEPILQELADSRDNLSVLIKAIARKILTSRGIYSITHAVYRLRFGEQMYQLALPRSTPPNKFFARCPRFSSALILSQLSDLEWNLNRRRKIAEIYCNELENTLWLKFPNIPKNCFPAWMQFPILVNEKGKFYKHMQRHGVDLSWTWRYSCAESFGFDGFPNTRKVAKSLLGLPTYPSLTDKEAYEICEVAKNFKIDS